MSDRGEYRAIHVVLMDGPDFQRLTPEARWVFIACRLSLGPSGIDVVPGLVGALEERTGYDAPTIRRSLDELHAGGWIELERNVLWVIEGLRHEPGLNVNNANHRASVINHAKGLPHLPIVERFRAHYPDWINGPDSCPGDGMGNGIPDGIGMGYPIREEGEGKGNRERDKNPSPSARESKPISPPLNGATVRSRRDRIIERFPEADREKVIRFLDAVDPPRLGTWEGKLDMWTQGHDLPPPPPKVTSPDIAQGLDDYLASETGPRFNANHVRGYVVNAARRRENPNEIKPANGRGPLRPGGTIAQRTYANALAARDMPPLPGDS